MGTIEEIVYKVDHEEARVKAAMAKIKKPVDFTSEEEKLLHTFNDKLKAVHKLSLNEVQQLLTDSINKYKKYGTDEDVLNIKAATQVLNNRHHSFGTYDRMLGISSKIAYQVGRYGFCDAEGRELDWNISKKPESLLTRYRKWEKEFITKVFGPLKLDKIINYEPKYFKKYEDWQRATAIKILRSLKKLMTGELFTDNRLSREEKKSELKEFIEDHKEIVRKLFINKPSNLSNKIDTVIKKDEYHIRYKSALYMIKKNPELFSHLSEDRRDSRDPSNIKMPQLPLSDKAKEILLERQSTDDTRMGIRIKQNPKIGIPRPVNQKEGHVHG